MGSFASAALQRFSQHGWVAEGFSIASFLLAVLLIARLMSEKRAPANTFAWLLVIALIPYLGVPLYLLFGGRKLRRLAGRKSRVLPKLRGSATQPAQFADSPVAHTISSAGGGSPVAGNALQLLTTGEATFAALEREILAARQTIHITTFILGKDATGRRLVALLARRAAEGIKVRLLLDAVGCLFFEPVLRRSDPPRRGRGRPVHARAAVHVPGIRQPPQPPQDRDLRPRPGDDRRPQPGARIHGADALPEALE